MGEIMRIKGFLVVLLLVVVLAFFLWTLKRGGKEPIRQEVETFSRIREETTRMNMGTLERAIDLYIAQNGRVPERLGDLRTLGPSAYQDTDAWGTTLKYEKISDSGYRLVSAGADRSFGTGDDIVVER